LNIILFSSFNIIIIYYENIDIAAVITLILLGVKTRMTCF